MFSDIFNDLLAERSLNRKKFAEQSGIPYPTVIGWTNLNRLPDYTALGRLADFFGCSVDFLMGREDGEQKLSEELSEERKLIRYYRDMDEALKPAFLRIAEKLTKD